ncbi:MAG: hypothetical protein KDK36_21730 [Leptospiraceae bacterium]|nr:hypothetical protein [Leptospiraceae bacterium]
MPRLEIKLADFSHEELLKEFNLNQGSGKNINLGLLRNPSYFDSLKVEGNSTDIIIGFDPEIKKIVGVGHRSERHYFYNGNIINIGYLSGLYLLKEYRNSLSVFKGYELLRKLHEKSSSLFYYTSIFSDNLPAQKFLTSKKLKLPIYDFLCNYTTFIISSKVKIPKKRKFEIIEVGDENIKEVYDFYFKQTELQNFYPYYSLEEFSEGIGLLNGVKYSDFIVLKENNKIIAMAILWDQSKFRNWKVYSYSKFYKLIHKPYNLISSILKKPTLPAESEYFKYRYLTNILAENNNPEIFNELFSLSLDKLHKESAEVNLLIGLSEINPFYPILKKLPSYSLNSKIYMVYWEKDREIIEKLKIDNPIIEVGSL